MRVIDRCLVGRHNDDVRDVDMRRTSCTIEDAFGDVIGRQWLETLIDGSCPFRISMKTDLREFCLNHAGINANAPGRARDAHRTRLARVRVLFLRAAADRLHCYIINAAGLALPGTAYAYGCFSASRAR